MEIMYVKYINGRRHSIIKEGENTIINDSKIIPFEPVKKTIKNELTPHLNNPKSDITSELDYNTDEKITAFFFNAIHENYLLNKKK